MSTVVIGIGKNLKRNKEKMEQIAGEEGKVFLVPDFVELNKQLDALLAAACGKLVYCDVNVLIWCPVT